MMNPKSGIEAQQNTLHKNMNTNLNTGICAENVTIYFIGSSTLVKHGDITSNQSNVNGNNNFQDLKNSHIFISGNVDGSNVNNSINIGSISKNDFITEAFDKLTFSQRAKVIQLMAKLLKEQENQT